MQVDENTSSTNLTMESCLLLPKVYQDLRKLATRYLQAEAVGQTLSGTALVHEAFVRLYKSESAKTWGDTRHFFFTMASTMRRILVDRARHKKSLRRGGKFHRVLLDADEDHFRNSDRESDSIEELNDALHAFEKEFPAAAELISLWYYGGLTMGEAAQVIGISRSTAHRHWQFAKAWLARQIVIQRRS